LTLPPPCGNSTDVVVATRVQARRSRLRSATALAVAALLVVANLVAHWHQATVVHARCAEHGEVVHAADGLDDGADHATAAIASDQAPVAIAILHSRAAGSAGDDHEHCDLCPLTREPLRLGAAVAVAAPAPLAVAAARAPSAQAAVRTIDRVRFAPKTSPPSET
jgi:hypothetical protein